MKFNEVLALLQKVHNGTDDYYLRDISEQVGCDYLLGIKRQNKDCIVLSAFVEQDELLEFEKSSFYVLVNGVVSPYPFKCEDFLADDWECCLTDWDGKYYRSFTAFLQDKNSEVLSDSVTAISVLETFLEKAKQTDIEKIEVNAVFSQIRFNLNAIDDLREYPKNECFTIEVFYKNGESEYLNE